MPSVLLLYGLALETALKGLLRTTHRYRGRRVGEITKWKGKGSGHDLRTLYEKTHLPITSEEQDLLDALSEAVLWSGRYPAPKIHDNKSDFPIQLGLRPRTGAIGIQSLVPSFSDLKNSWDALYSRILSRYPEQNNDDDTLLDDLT